jgi:hypothetical protein
VRDAGCSEFARGECSRRKRSAGRDCCYVHPAFCVAGGEGSRVAWNSGDRMRAWAGENRASAAKETVLKGSAVCRTIYVGEDSGPHFAHRFLHSFSPSNPRTVSAFRCCRRSRSRTYRSQRSTSQSAQDLKRLAPAKRPSRVDHFGADSAPGGSWNGSIGIGAYSTSRISRCSVFFGARRITRSPGVDFIKARARGDIQLM